MCKLAWQWLHWAASGLDELTREELIAVVMKLYETVELQAKRTGELEEEVARLGGGRASLELCIKPSVGKKKRGPGKKRKQSFSRHAVDGTGERGDGWSR